MSNKHIKQCSIYAVTTGTYVGEMLVLVREDKDSFHFLSIPKNINRQIPKEKIEFGLEHSIIEFVQRLPEDVNNVIVAQFNKNENSNY